MYPSSEASPSLNLTHSDLQSATDASDHLQATERITCNKVGWPAWKEMGKMRQDRSDPTLKAVIGSERNTVNNNTFPSGAMCKPSSCLRFVS